MKLRRESRILKAKAVSSLKRAATVFNSYEEEGRVSTVLLHLQHSFEMLLKAGLVQKEVRVFDPKIGKSIGFDKCVNLGRQHVKLGEDDAGLLRTIDALRDEEQHWITATSEGILYAHVRGGVTLFDEILQRSFEDRLSAHIPTRVLPISAEPPRDIQLLIDDEYSQIKTLLEPKKRKRTEARARIRSLLALEAHVAEEVIVSSKDVDRVEKGIRKGAPRDQVFPRLAVLNAEIAGEGVNVTVHFTKKAGAPVHYAESGEAAAAIREVDLQKKYHWTKIGLAQKLGLKSPRALALRRHLGIDDDENCRHDFIFGSQVHTLYSDNALAKMREALETVDMEDVWKQHGPRAKRK